MPEHHRVLRDRACSPATSGCRSSSYDGGTAEITADRWVIAAGVPGGHPRHRRPGRGQTSTRPTRSCGSTTSLIGCSSSAAATSPPSSRHVFSSFGVQGHPADPRRCAAAAPGRRHLGGLHRPGRPTVRRAAEHRGELRATGIRPARDGVIVERWVPTESQSIEADLLLVATGRTPNGDRLDVERDRGASSTTTDGWWSTSTSARTSDGIWALGDVSSPWQLKHVANHEARVVAHNLAHPDDLVRGRPPVRPGGRVHRSADRLRRADRAAGGGAGHPVRGQDPAATATSRPAGRGRTPTNFCKVLADPRPACCSAPTSSDRRRPR